MSNGTWQLDVDPKVRKKLKRVPRKDAEALIVAIELLPANPYFGDVEKMGGEENSWRRRVGSYRIFFRIYSEQRLISVFLLKRRTSTTY